MTRILPIILPGAIAGAGIVLAQAHGGPFWVLVFGSAWKGWGASGLFEAGSVWLWWRGDTGWVHWGAKWACTVLLIGGMAAQSAGPLLSKAEGAGVAKTGLGILEAQAEAGFWINQGTLRRVMKAAGMGEGGEAELPAWALKAVAAGVGGAMTVLYGLALLAIRTMGAEWRGGAQVSTGKSLEKPAGGKFPKAAPAVSNGKGVENWDDADGLAGELAGIIRTRWPNGTKMAVVEHETGISSRDLSLLLNHKKNKAAGGRTHGLEALRGLAGRLG